MQPSYIRKLAAHKGETYLSLHHFEISHASFSSLPFLMFCSLFSPPHLCLCVASDIISFENRNCFMPNRYKLLSLNPLKTKATRDTKLLKLSVSSISFPFCCIVIAQALRRCICPFSLTCVQGACCWADFNNYQVGQMLLFSPILCPCHSSSYF